jgi:hypothetical protein
MASTIRGMKPRSKGNPLAWPSLANYTAISSAKTKILSTKEGWAWMQAPNWLESYGEEWRSVFA